MRKRVQLMMMTLLVSGCAGNIAWKHPNYSSTMFDTDNNECTRKADQASSLQKSTTSYSQTSPGLVGYTTSTLNAAAADNLAQAMKKAIFYRPEYKKCMKAKGYFED